MNKCCNELTESNPSLLPSPTHTNSISAESVFILHKNVPVRKNLQEFSRRDGRGKSTAQYPHQQWQQGLFEDDGTHCKKLIKETSVEQVKHFIIWAQTSQRVLIVKLKFIEKKLRDKQSTKQCRIYEKNHNILMGTKVILWKTSYGL